MATRLLVIHKQLVFAVTIKQALEQTGGFAVHPFTKAEAAFDFLRDHPQDIALVDFNLPGRSGARIVQQLRVLQPDIAVIVTPQLSAGDMHNLGVQASIESPFTARDLLPLVQNALDEVPSDSIGTAPLPTQSSQMTTSNLGEQKRIKRQQMGTTQNLGEGSLLSSNDPAKTNRLNNSAEVEDDKPQTKPLVNNPLRPDSFVDQPDSERSKPVTRPFIDNPRPIQPTVNKSDPFKTRNLEDSEIELNDLRPPKTKPFMDDRPAQEATDMDRFKTRNLDNSADEEDKPVTKILPNMPPESYPVDTRRLDNDADSPKTRDLGRQAGYDPLGTRPLDSTPVPPAPPEFSSLDRVLQSFGMAEPPPDEMDTPSVPTKDSDALRQFIATNSGQFDAESFDDVLGAIEPDNPEVPKKQRQVDFEGLVKSMQRDEPQRRLPDRQQQQLLDFVLTTGMDSVLKEIEKTKTGLLPKVEIPPDLPEEEPSTIRPLKETSFRKLAQEEPPLPTLEENGTVSDLLVGISDSNFRDVLALLNDADASAKPEPTQKPTLPPAAQQPDVTYFEDFLQSTTVDSDSVPVAPKPIRENYDFNFDYNDDDDGATVAGVVLRSTQENTSMPGEFSLDQLMSDINDRLTSHKLKVRPLPSWDMDTTAFHAPVTDVPELPTGTVKTPRRRRPGEPSFLPEMFPPDEIMSPIEGVPPELPAIETNEALSEVWTTRASEPSLEAIEPVDENAETMVEPGYFDETVMHEPTTAIGADMFSGILDEDAQYGETSQYDEEAESSNNQTAFDWNEPDVTVEVEPSEVEFESPHVEAEFDQATADDFDTRTILAQPPQNVDDFSSVLPEETFTPETVAAESWDVSEFEVEPTTENFSDEWDAPVEVEPIVANFNDAWDVPSAVEQEPAAIAETYPAAVSEEARIAQLALNLTQVSLEVSAEGTILTRNNSIIALAGHLSQQDTIELGAVINNDWGTGGQGARLRFITLPSSGKEYMLYSTGTEDDLILSMIFAGSTPLRVIRQQGQRLVKALGEVPEVKPTSVAITPAQRRDIQAVEEALEPYAYVWLVRDPEQRLNSAVVQSITAGLMTQLSELRWQIEQLQVQDEYIYLYANVPGETPSYAVIRELKQRAASIAQKQDSNLEAQGLWADSYLVLSPGRELAPDEIQEFVDFQRMM